MNPGGIQASDEYAPYPHDITWSDFFLVQLFDSKLVNMTLTGANIYNLLEQRFLPTQSAPKVLLVSGIIYSYDLAQAAGSRITSLTLTDGTLIANDATT